VDLTRPGPANLDWWVARCNLSPSPVRLTKPELERIARITISAEENFWNCTIRYRGKTRDRFARATIPADPCDASILVRAWAPLRRV